MIGRRLRGLTLAVLALAALPTPSSVVAQPAAAFGQPLPDAKGEDRTVAVRVVAGDATRPVVGTDVTLTIVPADGSATVTRIARTDASGHAKFVDLPSGAVVTASVEGPGGTQRSTDFPVPGTGATRVMLSTVPVGGSVTASGPVEPSAGGGPMAGGGQPQPRQMSGRPRPQAGDPADTLTVRLTYDSLVDPQPPRDQPVVLVAFRHDHAITAQVVKTDPIGRAVFSGLDRSGATSYFAMTLLPRGADHDRLTSGPVQMIADDGLRLMLSGEKRDSDKPAVDDFGTLSPQPPTPTAPGVVDVVIAGVPEEGAAVELVDAVSGQVVSTAKAGPPLAAPGTTAATWKPVQDEPSLPTGSLEVKVTVDGQEGPPMTVEVRRRPAAAPTPAAPATPAAPLTAATAGGKATLTGLVPGEEVDVVVVTPGGPSSSTAVKVPAAGGVQVAVDVTWKERGQGGARLTVAAPSLETAYVVRTSMRNQIHLSAPFQLTPTRGAQVNLLAMPRIMLNFSLTSWVDDQFVVFTGQWTIGNSSWAPYVATKDGRPTELVVPVPKGAKGLQVRDDFAPLVGTDPARGLILRRPLPPGGLELFAGFSMPSSGGAVTWDMDLPLGSFESGLELLRPNDSTRVELPPEVERSGRFKVEEATDARRGKFWVLSPITIVPNERMVFRITGLPQPPTWHFWGKLVAGVAGLLVLALGIGFALTRGASQAARDAVASRYDRLLDELARLEREGVDPARRDAVRAELEALRERLDGAAQET